jgi:hypothetical protein
MKRATLIMLAAALVAAAASNASAQNANQTNTAVLHSPVKYPKELKNFCLNFQTGIIQRRLGSCDLRYGMLYAGDDWDWFATSISGAGRNVIGDLGEHTWNQKVTVPVVEPLAKLREGEQRSVTIDTSGAAGADGKPGENGVSGADGEAGADGKPGSGDDLARYPGARVDPPGLGRDAANRNELGNLSPKPKRNGKPKVSPPFVKAIAGHLYVIHVVDDTRDFYALFRVESLARGDNCTISWRFIPPPK